MSMTPYESRGVEHYSPPPNDLMTWAQSASEVHKMAQALAGTSFVPATLQGRPDEIAAQILFGAAVGMHPMVALQQIHVIERRPSISALAMRGLAQAGGVKFRYEEMGETRVKISGLAPGDKEWTTVTWTIDRAKKLGLTGKSNWTKQPQAMLIARATSELIRLIAAPLVTGLAYSTEELRDGVDVPYEPGPALGEDPPPPAKRTVKRAPVPEPPEVDVPEPAASPLVSDRMRRKLMASFNDADMADRATRLAYVSDVLKREVASVNEITDEDGEEVLAQLAADFPQALPQVRGE